MEKLPEDAHEFNKVMEEIDEQLRKKGVTIPQRQLLGALEFSRRFKVEFSIAPPSFWGEKIKDWFDKKYGDRLKVKIQTGEVVVLIKEDPYRLRLPVIFGKTKLSCDPRNYRDPTKKNRDVLNYIEELSPAIVEELSYQELKEIFDFFIEAYRGLKNLKSQKIKHLDEALGDLQNAVDNIMESKPRPGLSKWASLQFIEKVLKGVLKTKTKDENIPRTHNLKILNEQIGDLGGEKIPQDIIDKIQCSADVRYENELVSLDQAVEAHHASLEALKYLF